MKVPTIEPLEARIAPAILTISAIDSSKAEGNTLNGTTDFKFKVTLDAAEPQDVTVVATLADGTARFEDGDFSAFTQTITIPKGSTEVIFSVPIKQDTTIEANETFSVVLSSPSVNAAIGAGSATATILTDDLPKVSVVPIKNLLPEGSAPGGLTNFQFDIVLDRVSETDVTVVINTKDGTAKVADGDYDAFTQTVTIPAGQLKAPSPVSIPIKHDAIIEQDETFSVELSSPSINAILGTSTAPVTIDDDDPARLILDSATVKEGAPGQSSMLRFRVSLTTEASEDVTFDWATDGAGSALAGIDFTAVSTTVGKILAGQREVFIEVPILGDDADELDETVQIKISNAKMGANAITIDGATGGVLRKFGTIQNDDLTVSLAGPATIVEGNSPNATFAEYIVQLSGTSTHAVQVTFDLESGTAKVGSDFNLPSNLQVTIPAGATTGTLRVPITVDNIFEADETFNVRVKSVSNAVLTGADFVETSIVNDDTAPTLRFSQLTPVETTETNADVQFSITVSLSQVSGQDVVFDWSMLNGTALAGLDFEAVSSQTVTIPAGQLTTTLLLKTKGDKIHETSTILVNAETGETRRAETFSVVLSSATGATIDTEASNRTVRIQDNDAAPILKIEDAAVFEGEGANPRLKFKVSITNDVTSDTPILFNWAAGLGSATPGVDYTTATGSPATLAAGASDMLLELNINDDSIDEIDETLQVGITNAVMGSANIVIEDGQATGRILNDDLSLTLQAITGNVLEGATNTTTTAKYRISIPTASAHDVTVVVQFDADNSTASLGSDFTLPGSMTVTIPAGQTSVDFDVTVKGDTAFESNESITLKLVDPVNAKIGAGTAVATIVNDDNTAPELRIEDASIEEGDSGNKVLNFTVKLDKAAGEDITFDWSTIDGTALGGIDFSKVINRQGKILKGSDTAIISVALSGDTLVEVDETFTIQLSNAKLGSETITIADGVAIGTIENDDIQVRVSGATISEGTGVGTKNLDFTITLTEVSTQDVWVTFKLNEGTAKAGSDYQLPATLMAKIPAGQMSGTISIPIVTDSLSEQNETFTVELADATNAKIGASTATGTIVNDDAAPTLTIENFTLSEGNSGMKEFVFKVKLSAASGQEVRVVATPTAGTAAAGVDFLANAGTVVFPLGPNGETETEMTFTVQVNGDTAFENNENFTVVLSNATGAAISTTNGTANGTITNDDVVPTLTITDIATNENAGTINFTISLSAASGLPITFTATTADGTAKAGKDFAAKTQNFTIAPGQTTATFSVAITDDGLFERDETLSANLTNIVGAANTTASATGTITDNELVTPTVTVSDVTVVEGNTGEKEFEVTISLTQLAGSDVTFDWDLLTGGTATENVDYEIVDRPGQLPSQLTIPAGESSVKIRFKVLGDSVDEADETFTIQVSNPKLGNGTLDFTDTKSTSVVTLQNDDLTVSVGDATVVEGNSTGAKLRFTVTLSGASTHPVVVKFKTQDGTAISTPEGLRDFIARIGAPTDSITFAPGETTQFVEVDVVGDLNFDGTDQMKLILTSATNARIADGEGTGTITDDDARPVISIDTPEAILEGKNDDTNNPDPAAQTQYKFIVRLDHASDETVEVSVSTVNGTAVAGSDFTGITNQRVVFAPGETEKTVIVTVLNDSIYEADQSFDLVLSDPLRASLAPIKKATGTIEADDDARPTIQITGQSILEGDNGERFINFTVQRNGATDEEIRFNFETINGTAIAGANGDFVGRSEEITMLPGESTKTITVKVNPDTLKEADEQFQARITPVAGPGEGAIPGATLPEGHDGTATATILNDDLTVSLDQGVIEVLEGNSGQSDLVFKVKLSATTDHPIVLTYEIQNSAGTATFGTDYLAPTVLSVTIPAGSDTGEIRIPIVGDSLAEVAETVSIKLTGATNAELATSDLTATGTILNDDASLSIGKATRIEGSTGSSVMRFVVKLDAAFSYPVTVNYATADGSATAGSDYTATQGSITFALGETEKFIDVPILGDTNIEGDETFSVVLSNASGATILTNQGTGIGTIQDDESAFSINDVTIDEGDGGTRTINFTISRSPGSAVGATVRVSTLDGTAISNGLVPDFISKSEVITFAANETSKTFSVVVNGDRVFELGAETFKVVLSDATGAAILDGEGTGTIANGADAKPTLRINDASVVEGNEGTKVLKFTVALSEAVDAPVTFDFETAFSAAGFAANGEDFVDLGQSFTIPAGQKTFDIEVHVNGDGNVEHDEVLLGKITNAKVTLAGQAQETLTITDGEAIGTIRNDDLFVSIVETASGLEGNSGNSVIKVTVELRDANGDLFIAPEGFEVPITLQVASGTAILGTDFLAPTLTAKIQPGASSVDIDVQIIGDTLHEDDETFTVTLTGAEHAQLGNTVSTVTIDNVLTDDPAPGITVENVSVIEGQNAIFKVKLSAKSAKDVVVKWVTEFVEDSADPSDFTHSGVVQTLTIPAGQTEGTISIATTTDSADEFAETFHLRILSTTENATLTGDIVATATIEANDFGAFQMGDASVTEGASGTKTLAFTVTRTASNLPASVRYVTSDGTAKAGTDYEAAEGTLMFAAGESSKTVLITINGDNLSEVDETFFVGLLDAQNGTVADTFATGKILNDEISYRIAFADKDGNLLPTGNKVTEGDGEQQFAYFYVIRDGGAGNLGVSGTVFYSTGQDTASGAVLATAGSDFTSSSGTVSFSAGAQRSQLLKVPITPDMLAEGDETFLIKLSNPVNGQLSTTEGEKVVTIEDDDRSDLPYIVIENAKLVEGGDGATTDMVFKVKLVDITKSKAQAAGGAIKVTYSTADLLAAAGIDYTAAAENATITFAAGETEKEIRILILGDAADEVDETFNVKINSAVFITPGTNVELPLGADHLPAAPAVGTITNDDLTITLDPQSGFVEGDGAHTISIKAVLSQASTHAVTFMVKSKDGTAIARTGSSSPNDFDGIDQLVTIPAGLTEFTFDITVNGDVFSEADETFTLLLSDPVNAKLGTTSQVITIQNDDAAPSLSIGDASIVEGDNGQANLVFTVVLSGATNEKVTFDYKTVDGTAKSTGAIVDYLTRSGSLSFDASSSATQTKEIIVPIRGDTWMEATENFTVELSNAKIGGSTSGVTITDATATGQIVDNGDTILGVIVHDAKVVEGNTGETKQMQFTIETTAPVQGSAITLTGNTRAATAGSGDFTALQNHTITISAGQSQATVTVNVTGDNAYEAAEHLWLDVTGFNGNVKAVNGSATTASAAGVILNDDVNVISGREFQYIDTDGDLVTVKFSKGTLRVQTGTTTSDSNNITFSAINELGGRNLDLINLAVDGFAYEGVNISVTAKPQVLVTGEVLGDAKADVGTLTAAALSPDLFQISSGIGLGKVKISGNLDQLIAGSTKRPTGARLIEVGSFGSDSDQGSVVLGPISKMIVHGDFMGNIRMVGDVAVQPIPGGGVGRIGTLIIEGNLKGGTKDGSGRITFTGGIGTAKIGGIIGGSGQASGSISQFSDEFNTKIGSLTVNGDVVGASGANSAFVNVDNIGSFKVIGDVVGGGGANSAFVNVDRIGSFNVIGDVIGGVGANSAFVSANRINSLALGKTSGSSGQQVRGNLIGGSGAGSGYIVAETIGSVLINGDIRGGSGTSSGHLQATESLGNTRLTGSIIGGTNTGDESFSGLIQAATIRGALTIEGNVIGGSGDNSGLVFVQGSAKSITLGKSGASNGDLKGGSGSGSGRIDVNDTLSKFLAYGNIEGGKGASSGSLLVGNSTGTGSLTSAVIKGDIIGGSTDASGVSGGVSSLLGTGYIEADRIGSITVQGKLQSGQNGGTALAKSGGIHAGEIGTLNVGSVDGNAGTPVVISAVRSIGKATFGGNVEFLELLAGYSAPSDATKPRGFMYNAGATIGTVTVNGEMTASSIVAGVHAGNDGKFGTSDDVETVTGDSQNPNPSNQQLISRIASVVIKQVGTQSGVPVNAIVAEQINALKIASARVPLTAGAHNDGPDLVGSDGSRVQIFEI